MRREVCVSRLLQPLKLEGKRAREGENGSWGKWSWTLFRSSSTEMNLSCVGVTAAPDLEPVFSGLLSREEAYLKCRLQESLYFFIFPCLFHGAISGKRWIQALQSVCQVLRWKGHEEKQFGNSFMNKKVAAVDGGDRSTAINLCFKGCFRTHY